MSLQELQDEVARLSPVDRARLRAHLDSLEVFSDPTGIEEWTQFLANLDETPKDLPELRRLLQEPSIFVKS